MSTSSIPIVEPIAPPRPRRAVRENALISILGWVERVVVGVFMICNVFPLSFITAIAAFGWFQRRIQTVALYGWWKESPRRFDGTFQDFCDSLGRDAPVARPRWFWREHLVRDLTKLGKANTLGGVVKLIWCMVTLPVHSLWLNFKVGIAGLFTTYMLTGWGCSIMLFSWYFGWLNSFHKGYEDAFLGALAGLSGSFLLILALLYVPMAQAHQAAAGEISAFFQFRIVTRLILTRPTPYVVLIAGLALTSLIFEVPRLATLSDDFPANRAVSAEEAFGMVERYWFVCSIFFFLSLLILRTLSALIYRSAMLRAVRSGTILTSDLPSRLAAWFEKLEIVPQAQLRQHPLATAIKTTLSWKYRALLLSAAFLFCLLFVMRFYVGYFLVFNEYRGILNHPVIQVPCIDWTPWHLVQGREE